MDSFLPDNPLWISVEDALQAWDTGDGSGVRIAILDSGVDVTHDALAGLELCEDIAIVEDGDQIISIPGEGIDVFGHGTAIAHTIRKVAPAAEIGSIRVLGSGLAGKGDIVRAGVNHALREGYNVLNCSFGFSGRGHGGKLQFAERHKEWLDAAYLKGIHIVSACNNFDYRKTEWPGHFATSISVDKVDCEEDEFFYRPGNLVEFAAKGYKVHVPWLENTWKTVDGSSYAAPRVAAWLARLISVYPKLTPPQVKGLLRHLALERPFLNADRRG